MRGCGSGLLIFVNELVEAGACEGDDISARAVARSTPPPHPPPVSSVLGGCAGFGRLCAWQIGSTRLTQRARRKVSLSTLAAALSTFLFAARLIGPHCRTSQPMRAARRAVSQKGCRDGTLETRRNARPRSLAFGVLQGVLFETDGRGENASGDLRQSID